MANQWSDSEKVRKCMVAMVLAAALVGNGCAGVVMGSNSAPNGSGGPGTPTPATTPGLAASPMSTSFSSVTTGSSSSQTVTLQNSGTGVVTLSAASVIGAGFSTSGLALPMSIPPSQTATFNVVFAPQSAGSVSGSVSLMSDAPGSPLMIVASGNGVAPAASLTSSTTSLDFGSVLVGGSSSLQATLTNSGNANVTLSSVGVT